MSVIECPHNSDRGWRRIGDLISSGGRSRKEIRRLSQRTGASDSSGGKAGQFSDLSWRETIPMPPSRSLNVYNNGSTTTKTITQRNVTIANIGHILAAITSYRFNK